jgi:hypothetical protein
VAPHALAQVPEVKPKVAPVEPVEEPQAITPSRSQHEVALARGDKFAPVEAAEEIKNIEAREAFLAPAPAPNSKTMQDGLATAPVPDSGLRLAGETAVVREIANPTPEPEVDRKS